MAERRAELAVDASHEDDDFDERDTPRWLPWATLVLSVVGLAISIYLTIEHYTGNKQLLCSATAKVNCLKVTTSSQSVVFGVPVALYGLAFFIAMVALTSPWAWRAHVPFVHLARLAAVVVGMVTVVYLVYVELFQVDAICLWCTAVHAVTFLLFALVLVFGPTLTMLLARGER